MTDVPPICQAEECSDPPEYVCDAYVMVPPTRGFLSSEVVLCSKHAHEFEEKKQMSILTDRSNPDLVAVARWKD